MDERYGCRGVVNLPCGLPEPGESTAMDVGTSTDRRFRGYRFPAVIIGEVVWLRFRFKAGPARHSRSDGGPRGRGQP